MMEIIQNLFPITVPHPTSSPFVNMPPLVNDSDSDSDSDSHMSDMFPVFLASRGPIVDVPDTPSV